MAGRRFAPDLLTEMFRNPLDAGYVEAAERRARQGPVSARRRVAGRGARTVVLLATGFLLAVAYQQTVAAQPDSARARAGLVADVRGRQAEADRLQQRADALRDQVNRERDAALAGTAGDTRAIRNLEVRAGLSRVRGDGVVVQLTDAPQPVDPVTGQASGKNDGQVLDRDLQDVSNELWRDGAEAIAINGERLTATTTIRTAGSTILVDFKPIVSPYQIQAIGPDDLDQRFNSSDTGTRFHRYATEFGMGVSVRAQSGITLAAAPDPQLRYAQPIPSAPPATPARPSAGRSAQGGH
ncbi:MAG TPA: DUF881 domain-containing protein [Rugosimonospora sp.]|nr:DUF881 domain-containing protein [Rugosimonospora sp.]